MSQRRMIVTDALHYANGSLHLGHILGCVQSNIWARFQKLRGAECYYVCGSDAHGTPIMLNAEKLGITPEQLVNEKSTEQLQDFHDFLIEFDSFESTHDPINKALVDEAYHQFQSKGAIETKTIEQAYDTEKGIFLPDRFVKGTCPRCHAPDQYGDNCEVCGATYQPTELIDPVSVLSGTTPEQRKSEHYFFKLSQYQTVLQQWLKNGELQPEVVNKLQEWFDTGLQDWDISRDAPYFGFEIPDAPGKYFYVWLDAPIGYIASFKALCDKNPEIHFDDFWIEPGEKHLSNELYSSTRRTCVESTGMDSLVPEDEATHEQQRRGIKIAGQTELYHFIGKDILYFHTLFWPAMLHAAGYRMPTGVHTHGFLTVNGEKMSKSRGTFIQARDYLKHLDPEALRYYFAAKLGRGVDDIDLNLQDFMQRVNADLIGKYINIASRCAGFISKKFDGQLSDQLLDPTLFESFANASETIADHYGNHDYTKAMKTIMALADQANQFIEQHQPWSLAKAEDTLAQVQPICTMGLNLFKQLTVYLQPVLPGIANKTAEFLNISPLTWQDSQQPLLDHQIKQFKPLMMRITEEQIEALL